MTLAETLAQITPANESAKASAWQRWDSIAKPLRSLGLLEEAVVRIAGMTGSPQVDIGRRCLVIFCADNGVVAEGVTQAPQEVTAQVTENFAKGQTSVSVMARRAGVEVFPVDMGVARDLQTPGVLHHKIAYGTKNLAKEPAMTRAQAVQGVETGIRLAQSLAAEGCRLFATGEMGIGNTTTSSAIAAVLLGASVEEVTGRGAGLSTPALARKIAVIQGAIALHSPDPADPMEVLAKLGGYDIAGMAGLYLGAAAARVPVLVDGFISATAALVAQRLCPAAGDYLLASHRSKEPAGERLLKALGLTPFLQAEMCLGEGTGAVAAIPILDMAVAVYSEMGTFADHEIEQYRPLS